MDKSFLSKMNRPPQPKKTLADTGLRLKMGSVRKGVDVEFTDEELATHMAIYGGTGKGKSKLIELMIRQIVEQGRGACVIDPHGDLVEDLLAYILDHFEGRDPSIVKRIHYLEPGSNDYRFKFDPFHYDPIRNEKYSDWLIAKAMSVAKIIIRKQGEDDFEGRPRLERFLRSVLIAAGIRVNTEGDHFGLGDCLSLFESTQTVHSAIWSRIAPALRRNQFSSVADDLEKVFPIKPERQEEWIASTKGRLGSFLKGPVRSLFTGNAQESFNFRDIIEQQGVILLNLRRTRVFEIDDANAVGGLFIKEILQAAEIARRKDRKPYYLFVDEASRFVGQDLLDALAQFRKMKLSLCLAVQDLSSLRHRDVDMTAKVISQCGIHVTFQQKFPEDLEILGQLFGYPLLDFTPLVHEVDRFDGYEERHTPQYSSTDGKTKGNSQSASESRRLDSKYLYDPPRTASFSESESSQRSHSETTSTKTTFLSKYRQELQRTGRLERSIDDQFHKIKQELRTLGKGQAVVSVDGTLPFRMDVHHVEQPFPGKQRERVLKVVEGYKSFLSQNHKYCFAPSHESTEQQRLARFAAVGIEKAEPPAEDSVFGM